MRKCAYMTLSAARGIQLDCLRISYLYQNTLRKFTCFIQHLVPCKSAQGYFTLYTIQRVRALFYYTIYTWKVEKLCGICSIHCKIKYSSMPSSSVQDLLLPPPPQYTVNWLNKFKKRHSKTKELGERNMYWRRKLSRIGLGWSMYHTWLPGGRGSPLPASSAGGSARPSGGSWRPPSPPCISPRNAYAPAN